jgi:hypothetical protein
VRYEDLVAADKVSGGVFEYLELDFDPDQLSTYDNVDVSGPFGDPNQANYKSLTTDSVTAWRRTLAGF